MSVSYVVMFNYISGITSKYTSFIAIDVTDDKPSGENWVMDSRHVPSQFAHGWHGGMQPMQMMSCASAMPVLKMRSFSPGACFGSASSSFTQKRCKRAATKSQPESFGMAAPMAAPLMQSYSFGAPMSLCSLGDEAAEEQVEVEEAATPLVQTISQQSFDGSFSLNEKLCEILGKSLQELQQGLFSFLTHKGSKNLSVQEQNA